MTNFQDLQDIEDGAYQAEIVDWDIFESKQGNKLLKWIFKVNDVLTGSITTLNPIHQNILNSTFERLLIPPIETDFSVDDYYEVKERMKQLVGAKVNIKAYVNQKGFKNKDIMGFVEEQPCENTSSE